MRAPAEKYIYPRRRRVKNHTHTPPHRSPVALGLNHVALDVTPALAPGEDLAAFLSRLNADSERLFARSVKLVLAPFQQMIRTDVYEIAFIHDADGVLLELIRLQASNPRDMAPDW